MTEAPETSVILALGSNIGDRLSALRAAVKALAPYVQINALSPVYETDAAYVADQPAFLNAACWGTTKVDPLALLWALKDIESEIGRLPTFRYGPRVIDLDMIAYGDVIMFTPELTLPHPRIEERDFVLGPLNDILPKWRHPNGKNRVGDVGRSSSFDHDLPQRDAMNGAPTRPLVMGIINVTPDSFSGDGLLTAPDYVERAVQQAARMIEDGADILDIGGESSRPGSETISVEEEKRRVLPVVSALKRLHGTIAIAVDTTKASVAKAALEEGATIINDISALGDPAMGETVAQSKARLVLMHNSSVALAVQHDATLGSSYVAPLYQDVVKEVGDCLSKRATLAATAGITHDKIILDPGIGFGKTPLQNMALIRHLDQLTKLGFPLLVGVSRKSFIGHVLGTKIDERQEGTAACVAACILSGAHIVRVHDVKFMSRVVTMAAALRDA